jgi:hypothetical protein
MESSIKKFICTERSGFVVRIPILAFILGFAISCSGPCPDKSEIDQEVYFHYMALSTTSGGGSWEVSNIEEIDRFQGGDSCRVDLVVSGIYSNNSIPDPAPARMFSDSLTLVTHLAGDRKEMTIKYYK